MIVRTSSTAVVMHARFICMYEYCDPCHTAVSIEINNSEDF